MHEGIWRPLRRWLVAIALCGICVFPALIFLMWIPGFERLGLGLLDASPLHPATIPALALFTVTLLVADLSLWILPSAIAVGSALRASWESRIRYGLTIALLLGSTFYWFAEEAISTAGAHAFALTSGGLLICGAGISFISPRAKRLHFAAIAAAFLVLIFPYLRAMASAPRNPPDSRMLWSVSLDPNPWQFMNTGSSYESTRHAIFAGDRIVAVFDVGSAPYEEKEPRSRYRLVSLDIQAGSVRNSKELVGRWGMMPSLYATADGQVLLSHRELQPLNPDLSSAGPSFTPNRGRISLMSPDGTTMAWETFPRTTLLDARTLTPLPQQLKESAPTAASSRAVLTDNIYWYGAYPHDHSFVTLVDEGGRHLLFHGECGGRPEFLNTDRILLTGCGDIRILDLTGKILRETRSSEGSATFAGVSRNGARFAVSFTKVRGDPPVPLYEHFVIYDAETAQPVAIVRIKDLPEYNSWFAFSPDGRSFVAGSPYNLSLYTLP